MLSDSRASLCELWSVTSKGAAGLPSAIITDELRRLRVSDNYLILSA